MWNNTLKSEEYLGLSNSYYLFQGPICTSQNPKNYQKLSTYLLTTAALVNVNSEQVSKLELFCLFCVGLIFSVYLLKEITCTIIVVDHTYVRINIIILMRILSFKCLENTKYGLVKLVQTFSKHSTSINVVF